MRGRPRYYKLVGRRPVPALDHIEAAMWLKEAGDDARIVAKTDVGPLHVSTVFLWIDHQFSPHPAAPPILFETMVFGGEEPTMWNGRLLESGESYCERYSTWEEAEAGHARAVLWAQAWLEKVDATINFKTSSEQ